jgi:hypothetical protein
MAHQEATEMMQSKLEEILSLVSVSGEEGVDRKTTDSHVVHYDLGTRDDRWISITVGIAGERPEVTFMSVVILGEDPGIFFHSSPNVVGAEVLVDLLFGDYLYGDRAPQGGGYIGG